MGYGDECTRSHDIDNLERKTGDLDYDIRRVRDDLEENISQLKGMIEDLKQRIIDLENFDRES